MQCILGNLLCHRSGKYSTASDTEELMEHIKTPCQLCSVPPVRKPTSLPLSLDNVTVSHRTKGLSVFRLWRRSPRYLPGCLVGVWSRLDLSRDQRR